MISIFRSFWLFVRPWILVILGSEPRQVHHLLYFWPKRGRQWWRRSAGTICPRTHLDLEEYVGTCTFCWVVGRLFWEMILCLGLSENIRLRHPFLQSNLLLLVLSAISQIRKRMSAWVVLQRSSGGSSQWPFWCFYRRVWLQRMPGSTTLWAHGMELSLVLLVTLVMSAIWDEPSTVIFPPFALYIFVFLLLFMTRFCCFAKSADTRVWLHPASGRQITRLPLVGCWLGASHNDTVGVGMFAWLFIACAESLL